MPQKGIHPLLNTMRVVMRDGSSFTVQTTLRRLAPYMLQVVRRGRATQVEVAQLRHSFAALLLRASGPCHQYLSTTWQLLRLPVAAACRRRRPPTAALFCRRSACCRTPQQILCTRGSRRV